MASMSVRARMEALLEGWNQGRRYDTTSGSWKEPTGHDPSKNPYSDPMQDVIDYLAKADEMLVRASNGSAQLARKVKSSQPKKAAVAAQAAKEAGAARKAVKSLVDSLKKIKKL